YGDTYYSFSFQNDLFIVLDPNIDGWNISGEQMDFLKLSLNDSSEHVDNIFVFFHQLLWWKNSSIYTSYRPNSFEGKADTINFWSEVEPLLSNLSNEVFMFAGDVGAGSWAADFMHDKYGNISLIASGMGEGEGDNFVVTNVFEDKSVGYNLICLNDTAFHCFGDLTDYRLTTGNSQQLVNEEKILIYPNPASRKFQIRVNSSEEKIIQFHLYDLTGRKVMTKNILVNVLSEICFDKGNGLYLYRIEQNGLTISTGKLRFNNY
ncbi:MAG: T9SS type A sorting domain-containing protein, partial [Bacteroidales bacterium]|nr:T9SS type A sorting domain-containing protein [Bacteroidales bacterium]